MIPDAKWLDALRLPFRVNLSIALASSVLWLLDFYRIIDVDNFGAVYTRLILVFLATIFGTVTFVELAGYLLSPIFERRRVEALTIRRAIRKKESAEKQKSAQIQVLARLDHLSAEEIHFVAGCLRNLTPTFYTFVNSSPVGMLLAKGLAWTSGSQHHRDHYPFTFHDFVWVELMARRDEFLNKDAEHQRDQEARKEAALRRRY